MRGGIAATAAVLSLLGMPSAAAAQAVAYVGSDRVRLELPAGGLVEGYSNAGYHLRVNGGTATVEVDLAAAAQPRSRSLSLPPTPPPTPMPTLARAVAAGAATRYDAVTRVLQWVARNVAYDLDREEPQDAAAVLARRSGYCTGIARLSVALLQSLGIPAREVPGFLVAPAGAGLGSGVPAGFHRWVEVLYDDVGWVFSDPLLALHYVPATYVRLASEALLPEAEQLPGTPARARRPPRRRRPLRRGLAAGDGAPQRRRTAGGRAAGDHRRRRQRPRRPRRCGQPPRARARPRREHLRRPRAGQLPAARRGRRCEPQPQARHPARPSVGRACTCRHRPRSSPSRPPTRRRPSPSHPFPAQQSPRPTISEEEST